MKLSKLNKNIKAIIVDIDFNNLPINFSNMEFIPGSEIVVIRKNGFKGSLYVKVNENYIMIRMCTAELIEVSTKYE